MSMMSSRDDEVVTPRIINMENKSLEYHVEILDVQFNHTGRYFIKMTIQSLHTRDYSQIMLKKGQHGEAVRDYEALTDVTQQSAREQLVTFHDRNFIFLFPKGFCQYDKNHDVFLLVEAFSLPSNDQDMGKKVGEGKVAIYPRTEAPRPRHSASPGEDIYRYEEVVSLLRIAQADKSQMHCGRMRCHFALRERLPEMFPPRVKVDPNPAISPRSGFTPKPPKKKEIDLENLKKKMEARHEDPTPPPRRRPPVIHTPPHRPEPRAASPTSLWGDTVSLNLPKSPSPPPPFDGKRMTDSPMPDINTSTFSANSTWRHTARKGNEQFDVIVHGASSLPSARDGHVPLPYVTLKTRHEDDMGLRAPAKTHATGKPTHVPSWEEMLTVEIDDAKAENEALVLSVGDAMSKQGLVKYHVPVANLKPFHQYHLELLMPSQNTGGVKTYVSIVRRQSTLPRDPANHNFLALEVYLRAVQKPVLNHTGPLIAVARIVPDFHNYRSDSLQRQPRNAGVGMTSVTFPNPHPSAFNVPQQSYYGYPQISLVGRPPEQPRWNHPYLFCDSREKATMFTPSAALIIEYYVANGVMTDEFWKIRCPVGFSTVLLDQRMYSQLSGHDARQGLRLEGVPVQGSDLYCVDNTMPTVGMVLKLITTDQPESMAAVVNLDNLPVVHLQATDGANHAPDILTLEDRGPSDMAEHQHHQHHQQQDDRPGEGEWDGPARGPEEGERRGEEEEEEEESIPNSPMGTESLLELLEDEPDDRRGKLRLPIKDGDLPPYDAMVTILPEYQYIFTDTAPPSTKATVAVPATQATMPPTQATRVPDMDQMTVIDQQMKDTDRYRQAVTRMGHDIVNLRGTVRELEGANSKLRLRLNNYSDATRLIIDTTEMDGLPKAELASRYASLKQKLVAQTAELKNYKDKVQKLQNELIKKNDKEKEFLRLSHAHVNQQELLQKLQEKVNRIRSLEETCRKQEKVIEKLERILEKFRDKSHSTKDANSEANAALMEENRQLRQQLDDLREQMRKAGKGGGDDMEKLELYQALERAEGRIMSLEKQLQDNARQWGRERADLQIRVNENEHGFARTGGLVLHDYPR